MDDSRTGILEHQKVSPQESHNDGGISKGHKHQMKEVKKPKMEQFEQQNKIDYLSI